MPGEQLRRPGQAAAGCLKRDWLHAIERALVGLLIGLVLVARKSSGWSSAWPDSRQCLATLRSPGCSHRHFWRARSTGPPAACLANAWPGAVRQRPGSPSSCIGWPRRPLTGVFLSVSLALAQLCCCSEACD